MTATAADSITDPAPAPSDDAASGARALGGRRALAVCRLLLGWVFLWPAIDKTFGLGYATPAGGRWLDGASPTAGFLGSLDGPLAGPLGSMAGPVTDWLFMLGMLGTGLALLLGIGMRVAAVAGGLIMLTLWLSMWPFAPGSANPVVDQHLVYVALLVTLALTRAGDTWGLGRVWARSGLAGTATWLR